MDMVCFEHGLVKRYLNYYESSLSIKKKNYLAQQYIEFFSLKHDSL